LRPWRTVSLVFVLLLLGAGTAAAQRRGAAQPGGDAPAATVERFLRAAAEKDYAQMGQVFGTKDGPISRRDSRQNVERRMYAIATIIENQRFVIRDQGQIPGRGGEAMQLNVQLTQRGKTQDVPFVVVRSGQRWFVEQVELERVTRRQL
jgi:hypothetical protein